MTQTNEYQGPLAGLNVIDFGHYYAGPMVGMLLADQGATVVRIVRPGEPELPHQQYRLLNRNKKLLTLDLKTPEGKTQVLSLIERADVVIENFRPGVMKRLGLDYASVKDKNPGLVYLSLPGFASTDNGRAHIQAWDGVIAAAAGMYESHLLRKQLNFPPVYTWVPLTSTFGAMHGAMAVMAALNAREAHGFGTVVEVPLVEAGLSLYGDHFIFKHGLMGPLRTAGEDDSPIAIPEALKPFGYGTDDSPAAQEKKLSSALAVLYGGSGFYTTADGKKIEFAAYNPGHAQSLYTALGIYKQLRQEGYVNEGAWESNGLDTNLSGYGSTGLSAERYRHLKQMIAEVVKTQSAGEWETTMEKAGVPCAVLRTRDQWLALEPLRKSGVLTQMDNGQSVLTVSGRVADMSGPEGTLLDTRPSEPEVLNTKQLNALFQHSGVKTPQREKPQQKKGELLNGVKVLDLSNIIAGPESSYNLAQYGADVIKLEPPKGSDIPNNLRVGLEVYQGKRSLIIDIATTPGRAVFNKLVCWADIVVHNILDDTAKRLGVTHAQLQAINPNVVSGQLTCFGGTWRGCGGWEMRPGYDGEAQVPSGVMVHYGSLENPQGHGGLSNDVMTGLALAFSSLLGLYQKRKTGYAGEGRASLARSACFNQLPCMISENGDSNWGEPRGQLAVGPQWWQRIYQCRDGWVFAGTREDRMAEFAETVVGQKTADAQTLEPAFAEQDCAYWQDKFNAADIGCHRVLSVDDICAQGIRKVGNEAADETASGSTEVLCWDDHPSGIPIICLAPNWVRVGENHSYRRLTPAPRRGEHTREILQELGYTEEEIVELVRLRVAHEYLPAIGNKDHYFFEPENCIENPVS